eukprot:6182708-Pleurochrysis_carterae.AAC.4
MVGRVNISFAQTPSTQQHRHRACEVARKQQVPTNVPSAILLVSFATYIQDENLQAYQGPPGKQARPRTAINEH